MMNRLLLSTSMLNHFLSEEEEEVEREVVKVAREVEVAEEVEEEEVEEAESSKHNMDRDTTDRDTMDMEEDTMEITINHHTHFIILEADTMKVQNMSNSSTLSQSIMNKKHKKFKMLSLLKNKPRFKNQLFLLIRSKRRLKTCGMVSLIRS